MLEDRLLVWRLNRGSIDALSRIYRKYKDDLLRLATALSNDLADAEDIVQNVFLRFAQSAGQFQLTGSLRSYLATCVANRVRNRLVVKRRQQVSGLDNAGLIASNSKSPHQWVVDNEELIRLNKAIRQIPYEQREAITLHLQGGMKFKEIAMLQNVSIKTVFSRYRYGLDKLRSTLNSEVEK
jgi:RNA polymerase sigma-70 factor (ECF subfamily)